MLLLKKMPVRSALRLVPLILQAFTRLAASFLTVKAVTAYIAPSQFIVFGQLQTLMQIYSVFVTSVASTKLSSLVAKSSSDAQQNRITDTAVILIVALTVIMLAGSALFSEEILRYAGLATAEVNILILPIGASAMAYSALIQAYFTGVGATAKFGKNAIISVCLVAASTITLTIIWGFKGAVASVVVSPLVAGLVVGVFDNPIKRIPRFRNWDHGVGKEIWGFTAASLLTLIGYYCAQLYIRSRYALNVSEHEAGLLNATARISDVYMGVLSVIYANVLTRLYATVQYQERVVILARTFGLCIAVLAPGFVFMALTADSWIPFVLSKAYSEATGHMLMQLGADFLKCLYWIFIYYIISKHSYLVYFLLESVGLVIYVVAALLDPFGIEKFSPQVAQMTEYAVLLFLVNGFVMAKKHV